MGGSGGMGGLHDDMGMLDAGEVGCMGEWVAWII